MSAVAVVLAACSSAQSVSVTSPDPTTTVPATITTVVPTTASSSSTTTTLAPELDRDGTARALITTTEIVLPVLETRADGWVVRTPCQELALVTDGTVVDRVHVVIDPGHGGSEPGAVTESGLTEASVNLAVSELVVSKLDRLGFHALLTRRLDVRVPILTRVEIADRLAAPLLVSVHHQGLGDVPLSEVPGTEVYYRSDSTDARRLAGLVREEALDELGRFDFDWFTGPDAGASYRLDARSGEDFYGMVRRPQSVAVLAEMSFTGNPAEEELMGTRAFLDAEAHAITDAVVRWFTTDDGGVGFVEPSFAITSSGGGGGLGGCEDPDLGPTIEVPADVAERVGEPGDSG